jgi:hypothetical protein
MRRRIGRSLFYHFKNIFMRTVNKLFIGAAIGAIVGILYVPIRVLSPGEDFTAKATNFVIRSTT